MLLQYYGGVKSSKWDNKNGKADKLDSLNTQSVHFKLKSGKGTRIKIIT